MKRLLKKVLGFRSGRPWKMALASLWYLLALFVLFYAITTPVPVVADAFDTGLYRLSGCLIVLWMLSPAIFLSDTSLREHLPLFSRRQKGFTVLGMMIVFLFFAYLFGSVEELHSEVFKETFDSYIRAVYQTFVDAGTRSVG